MIGKRDGKKGVETGVQICPPIPSLKTGPVNTTTDNRRNTRTFFNTPLIIFQVPFDKGAQLFGQEDNSSTLRSLARSNPPAPIQTFALISKT